MLVASADEENVLAVEDLVADESRRGSYGGGGRGVSYGGGQRGSYGKGGSYGGRRHGRSLEEEQDLVAEGI